jgi:hypothetical protein
MKAFIRQVLQEQESMEEEGEEDDWLRGLYNIEKR